MDPNSSKESPKLMIVPPGLVEMLEGFVLVVLRDKPKDLVDYAAWYFSLVKTRKNSLKEHGASIEDLGVDFFIASEWNGLVWKEQANSSLIYPLLTGWTFQNNYNRSTPILFSFHKLPRNVFWSNVKMILRKSAGFNLRSGFAHVF